jgi:hypothetical protein
MHGRFKPAGVGTNGILQCKLPSKTVHRAASGFGSKTEMAAGTVASSWPGEMWVAAFVLCDRVQGWWQSSGLESSLLISLQHCVTGLGLDGGIQGCGPAPLSKVAKGRDGERTVPWPRSQLGQCLACLQRCDVINSSDMH